MVVSERELAFDLWGLFINDPGRAIEAHIYRIRKLLNALEGVKLETIRQRGYRLTLTVPKSVRLSPARSRLPESRELVEEL
jgi:DNA-binding response OmpR family regulator